MDYWKNKNQFLFIGAIGDAKTIEDLNSKGCAVSTGYNVQRKMIEGLEKQGYYSDTITAHVSPKNWIKNFIIDYPAKDRNEKVTDISIKFVNIPLLDKMIKSKKIEKYVKKWVKNQEEPIIFIYALSSAFLKGAASAKRENKNCKIISIVPDLPEFMSNSKNRIYRFLKAIDRKVINYYLRFIDGFVLFSEPMKERLEIENKPYVVVEGIVKDIEKEKYIKQLREREEKSEKVIMLSGNLDKEEGVGTLLDAFKKIKNSDYRLWLTGVGNCVEMIRKYEKEDTRIKYFGYIESYEEFLKLQQKSKVFVLMVQPSHPKSPYYFPSKIMEYLSTGGIVACFKLKCIPQEYDKYLEYFPNDIDGIAEKLVELCEKEPSKYHTEAMERYEFLKSKNSLMQMKKVLSLIKRI